MQGLGGQRALPVSYDNINTTAILDHFRTVADTSKVYALDMVPNAAGEVPIVKNLQTVLGEPVAKRRLSGHAALTPSRLQVDIDDGDGDLEEEHGGLPGQRRGGSILHFKVIHANPSQMKTVKVPLAAARRLQQDEANHTEPELLGCELSRSLRLGLATLYQEYCGGDGGGW